MATCASCGTTKDLKHCKTCKQVYYCSLLCQKSDFKEHKKVCRFVASSYISEYTSTDALSKLHRLPAISTIASSDTVAKCFNTAEIRMVILSLLSAIDVLKAQAVCHSWYRTIDMEKVLQQRLFLAAGPGKLGFAAYDSTGSKFAMGIEPRNKDQLDHALNIAKSGAGPLHLVTNALGNAGEERAVEVEKANTPIIIHPFFTKLWPQDPTNMTDKLCIAVSTSNNTASWRRMQLTSPPTLQLDMSVWYTHPAGKGNQARPSTGKIAAGVTMGHLADLLAALPSKHKLYWMSLDGHAWWARSADAVVLPSPISDGGKNEAMRGVYVNPSNGIPFPGAF